MPVTTLYFHGDHVAFISDISSPDGNSTTELTVSQQPFLPTDIIEIDIENDSIRPDGEFDYDEVIFASVRVIRDGVTYEFEVQDGSKVKESGADGGDSGQSVEQGDTFFVTNDDVGSPSGGPFGGYDGQLAFSLNETFADGEVTSITREQDITDSGGDIVGVENANFYTGESLLPLVPCFAKGTRILTPDGPCVIEDLQIGGMVVTRDGGKQPIRWIGSSKVRAEGDLVPYRVLKDALGNNRDLVLSPQHKVLITGWRAELVFGADKVLVAVKHLENDHSIRQCRQSKLIEYYHVMFDQHEVIFAEGCEVESLDPLGVENWPANHPARIEIETLYPDTFIFECEPLLRGYSVAKSFEANLLSDLLAQ